MIFFPSGTAYPTAQEAYLVVGTAGGGDLRVVAAVARAVEDDDLVPLALDVEDLVVTRVLADLGRVDGSSTW